MLFMLHFISFCFSLVKVVSGFAERSGKRPTRRQLKHAILRNFGGLENYDPVEEFQAVISELDKSNQVNERIINWAFLIN